MININNTAPLFEAEIMADLLTNDEDSITAALVATCRPDIHESHRIHQELLLRHAQYHARGLQYTMGHSICVRLISDIEAMIARAIQGSWN